MVPGTTESIHEFTIDDTGMQVERAFRNVTGIISGHPVHVSRSEVDHGIGLFVEDSPD